MKYFEDGRDWFFKKRFGMMVHWGLYSVGGIHEQEIWRFNISPREYRNKYMPAFNPEKFDPAQWIELARSAGMEYMVFTAKHHDGFCLWNTAETDYNVMNTPFGKDIIGMLTEECHRQDFPLVIYYSVVDWAHPAYPNIGRHHEIKTDPKFHNEAAYLGFLKAQLRELCGNYGKLHGIWWDMNVPKWFVPEIHTMIRELQPQAVINNRGFDSGDFSTPERCFEAPPNLPFSRATEACDSIGVNSWGYRRMEDYHSLHYLKSKIARYLALGGNFLLNAAPGPDGTFPEEAAKIFSELGKWYKKTSSALTAPPCYGIVENPEILCTGRGDCLNVILPDPPDSSTVSLAPFDLEPSSAVLLNDGSGIGWTHEPLVYQQASGASLRLRGIPTDNAAQDVPVLQLTFPGQEIRGKNISAEITDKESIVKNG